MNLAEQLIQRISAHRRWVVIIGDAMCDNWVTGDVETCQDECPKFTTDSSCVSYGGAANAHSCLAHWPVNRSLHTYPDDVWPIKNRLITPGGTILFRWDDERDVKQADKNSFAWEYATARALEMVNSADAVLLSDYDKGFLTHELIAEVSRRCAARNVPCVADCKRAPEVYAGCILKGNAKWWRNAVGVSGNSTVVTCGASPPTVWSSRVVQDMSCVFKLPHVECVNHVGAGDCFAVHLALALAYGFSLKEAAAIAHSAGRVYVQHAYNRPPWPDELVADMAATTMIA